MQKLYIAFERVDKAGCLIKLAIMEDITKQRIAVSAVFFQCGLCFASWASRIPDIKENFHLTESELGGLLLLMPIGSLIGLPLAGWFVDKFGSRTSTIISCITYSLLLFAISLAPTIYLLALVLLFFGMAGNLYNISINTQALMLQNSYGRVIMASFHGLWSLGGFCGAALGALSVYLKTGIVIHYLSITILVLVMLIFSQRFLIQELIAKVKEKFVFKRPDSFLIKLGIISFCGMMCEGCMFDWSGVYFKQVIATKTELIATGYIAFMSTMALGRFVADSFINNLGTKTILFINGVLIFVGLTIAVAFPYLVPAILGFFLVGLGTSSVIPLAYSETGKTTKFSPGVALAIVSTIGYLGFLLGPPIIGFIAQAVNLRFSFEVIAFVGLTISIMVGLSSIRNRRNAKYN